MMMLNHHIQPARRTSEIRSAAANRLYVMGTQHIVYQIPTFFHLEAQTKRFEPQGENRITPIAYLCRLLIKNKNDMKRTGIIVATVVISVITIN